MNNPFEDLNNPFGFIKKKPPHEQAEELAKQWARLLYRMKKLWP